MGLLDFLKSLLSGGSKLQCPGCGTIGAQQDAQGRIRCKNPSCQYFDASSRARATQPRTGTTVPTQENFRPTDPLTIRYRNFAGQERSFVAERGSLVRKRNHLVGRVAPTGAKIVLSRDRIQNLSEVEARLPQRDAPGQDWPSPPRAPVAQLSRKARKQFATLREDSGKVPELVSAN